MNTFQQLARVAQHLNAALAEFQQIDASQSLPLAKLHSRLANLVLDAEKQRQKTERSEKK
ncbi:hypothetical protein [Marinagarivorans algicola]|uniref:hypothetical protein n=1 Tax=Marinagarivorans algicola TaxID=1513270 RepID=UPI0037370287